MRDESWNSAGVGFIDLDLVPTDVLVYSERELEQPQAAPSSLVGREFPTMTELL